MFTTPFIGYSQRPVAPKAATWNDVLYEARSKGCRITNTEQLWGIYQEKPDDFLIVDTRQEWKYARVNSIPSTLKPLTQFAPHTCIRIFICKQQLRFTFSTQILLAVFHRPVTGNNRHGAKIDARSATLAEI